MGKLGVGFVIPTPSAPIANLLIAATKRATGIVPSHERHDENVKRAVYTDLSLDKFIINASSKVVMQGLRSPNGCYVISCEHPREMADWTCTQAARSDLNTALVHGDLAEIGIPPGFMFFVQISDPAQSWAHSTLVLFAPCNPDPETLKKMPPPVPWTGELPDL